MRWDEFQNTAERLVQGAAEGDWRSGTSRGYYAVFHYFRDFLQSHGLNVGRAGQAHFNLYTALLNCGCPAVAPLGSRVGALRDRRILADYEMNRLFFQQGAVSDVQESRKIVSDFQAVLATIPPALIVGGARQHLQAIGHLGKSP